MYIGLYVKCPFFLSNFNKTLNFIDRFFKNNQAQDFMKIRPVGAELFCADGRTDGEIKT
jgi:hypothetical protein